MKTIIAKAGASGTQTHRVGDLQGVATSSTAQNAVAWGETATQTYAINDNIVYRHAINNANARASGVQIVAQTQIYSTSNNTAQRYATSGANPQSAHAQVLQSKHAHTTQRGRGEGYSLSLSLSLV